MTCLADIYDNLRNPVSEYVDLQAAKYGLSVVQADAVMQIARTVINEGGSRAAACEAARRAAVNLGRKVA